jgi:uncharacterized protein with HEPN domain
LRREQLYLLDILRSCQKIQAYAGAIDKDEFAKHDLPFDGIVRHLGIIGEAVRNLSPETRALAPEVAWGDIIRLRNIMIHRYFGLDDETLWGVVGNDVPDLARQVESILATAEVDEE